MNKAPFVINEYVRWSDVDHAGIIFYGAYVRFFEIAETELFRAAGVPYGDVFNRFNIWLPRVHLNCDFHHPTRLDDHLHVAVYFTRFGTSSVTINFDVLHAGKNVLAASALEVLVCVDRDHLRKRPLPDELRKRLEPYMLDIPQARARIGLPVSGDE